MLACMVARHRPPPKPPNVIERAYAQAKRDDALRQAGEFRLTGNLAAARRSAREAARWDREVQELLQREKRADAKQRRDYFAKIGIELAEAGDLRGARAAAKEAQHWDRVVRKLGSG